VGIKSVDGRRPSSVCLSVRLPVPCLTLIRERKGRRKLKTGRIEAHDLQQTLNFRQQIHSDPCYVMLCSKVQRPTTGISTSQNSFRLTETND